VCQLIWNDSPTFTCTSGKVPGESRK
jgi:hypothetical protein